MQPERLLLAEGVFHALHVHRHLQPADGCPEPGADGGHAEHIRAGDQAGRMIDNGGLMPLSTGARVRILDGELSVIDGPFVEAKEVIGGYAIFELRDKAEAVAMAKEFMQLHLDHMPGWEGTCELRAFATPGLETACQVDAQSRVAAHA
ncbi:hypothetical protein BJS_05729 [Bradyrhizobium japonicum SEMIA 5079]|nr:hypothetical protein BJS_05729 [Bradyrhizobium japonicum SEMIA 5079]